MQKRLSPYLLAAIICFSWISLAYSDIENFPEEPFEGVDRVEYNESETPYVLSNENPPRQLITEQIVQPPGPNYTWIGGHWRWVYDRWVWVDARWEVRQPYKAWKGGHWREKHERGWKWINGHWE